MGINLRATLRARKAILGLLAAATIGSGGYHYIKASDGNVYPAPVVMAVDLLVENWEGLSLTAYWDEHGQVWTAGFGETEGVGPNTRDTKEGWRNRLLKRVNSDFYPAMLKCAPQLKKAPDGFQAAMIAGAYNFGTGSVKAGNGWCGWGPGKYTRAENWLSACRAQATIVKSGGEVLTGLVRRRGMGDRERIGEGELCVTALEMAKEGTK